MKNRRKIIMFKKGDIVRCVEEAFDLTLNKNYTVIDAPDSVYITVMDDSGSQHNYFISRFELYETNSRISYDSIKDVHLQLSYCGKMVQRRLLRLKTVRYTRKKKVLLWQYARKF